MTVPRSILSRELLPASIAIYTAIAIVAFEGLAVTAALPDLTAELGDVELLPWVVTGFLLASGVATAIAGSFIDSLGTSTVFRWATIGFAAASLAAAAARTHRHRLLGARQEMAANSRRVRRKRRRCVLRAPSRRGHFRRLELRALARSIGRAQALLHQL